jgi:soluble lytic murein transglycosylase-like protein
MARIEAAVAPRVLAAERVKEAARFVDEAAAARKKGEREKARDQLKEAERIAATAQQAGRIFLIDELARAIAAEREALNPPAPPAPKQLPLRQPLTGAIPQAAIVSIRAQRETLGRILEQENVPIELLAVAFIESRFNPQALSPKGARGIWQFMPGTAERYGLAVRPTIDHRTHPEHSTRAAAMYLRDLYRVFGDWKLALAAYNWGEGNIQRVIARTGMRDFDEMARRRYLPLETRKYVPAVLALAAMVRGASEGVTWQLR